MARTDKDTPAWVRRIQETGDGDALVVHYPWTPGRQDRRDLWFGPERASVRDQLAAARRDYNAYGDTDVEPEPRQHRHAIWGGGWWD